MNADERRLKTSSLSAFIRVYLRPICLFQQPAGGALAAPVECPPESPRRRHFDWRYTTGAVILFVIAVSGVASTWSVLSATFDEPLHIACGMEWLDKGTYTRWLEQPPLGRIVVAIGPYLAGVRSFSLPNSWAEGNAILYSRGNGDTLALARSGNLVFPRSGVRL